MTSTETTATRRDLRTEIEHALESSDASYDIDAIADTLWQQGITTVDDADDFWTIVAEHETAETTSPSETFRAELSATITRTRTDRPALWQWDSVAVRARGISRVNQSLPQPLAEVVVTTPTEEVRLSGDDLTWDRLWTTVQELHESAETTQTAALRDLRDTARTEAAARQAHTNALHARDIAIHAAAATGTPVTTIATTLGLSDAAIRKVLAR